MKKPVLRHKAKRNLRCCAMFLLCCILAVSFYAPPALGAQAPGASASGIQPSAAPENGGASPSSPETSSQPGEPSESSAPQETSSPALADAAPPDAQESETESSSSEPEEEPVKTYTLTFNLGSFGVKTLTVEEGAYPSEVPAIPDLPAAYVLGWFDQAGEQANPASIPAERDAAYTARWSRQVSDLLNTQEHFAYIKGYANGMFRPQAGITRAEAAQLFYNLLQNREWERKSFSDVPETQWYAEPVGTMAALGVLQGYKDGTFQPNREITRAEFVKMAVACDTIGAGENPFSDVSASSWAAPYVATAAAKGWISGYKDGTFHPEETITRDQAVAILNKMLDRSPDADVKSRSDVKNFYDVYPTNWAYGDIVEASTSHSYTDGELGELWGEYEKDESKVEKSGWVKDGSDRYYLDAKTRKFLRGAQTIDGKKYLLDASTGVAVTGFRNEGSWRRYYKNGLLQEDISGLGVVSGPYYIKVYKQANYLIIFAQDDSGKYTIPVRSMRVSCGYGTPTGTFYTPDRYRWLKMEGDTYAQWCTQIQGNYLFHSVPNWTYNNFDLEVGEYNHLGDTRSLGCIRLNCRDAKWIYDNCVLGTKVFISGIETSGPLQKPAGLQIPSWHTWDPTDPTAYWKCRQKGCH